MSVEVSRIRAEGISVVEALAGVPRLSSEQWLATGSIARWMIVSRAAVLIMTFCAVALGGVLALIAGQFDATMWLLCLLGSLLAHATNNQLNDLVDSDRGIDKGNYFRNRYGAHALEQKFLDRNGLLQYIAMTGACALLIGLLIAWLAGPMVLMPMAAGAALLVFYTYPLKQLGLGEIAVLVVWGPLMTGGTYLAITGVWSWEAAILASVFALGPTAVIFGKHIDKIDFDTAKGVRTLPVRMGSSAARHTVIAMIALQYCGVLGLVVAGWAAWPLLLVLLAIPAALRLISAYRHQPPANCPPGYPDGVWPLWYSAIAFAHTRSFGPLFLIAMLMEWLTAR